MTSRIRVRSVSHLVCAETPNLLKLMFSNFILGILVTDVVKSKFLENEGN